MALTMGSIWINLSPMKVTTMEVTPFTELYFLHACKNNCVYLCITHVNIYICHIYIYIYMAPFRRKKASKHITIGAKLCPFSVFPCFSPKESCIVSPSFKLIFQSWNQISGWNRPLQGCWIQPVMFPLNPGVAENAPAAEKLHPKEDSVLIRQFFIAWLYVPGTVLCIGVQQWTKQTQALDLTVWNPITLLFTLAKFLFRVLTLTRY